MSLSHFHGRGGLHNQAGFQASARVIRPMPPRGGGRIRFRAPSRRTNRRATKLCRCSHIAGGSAGCALTDVSNPEKQEIHEKLNYAGYPSFVARKRNTPPTTTPIRTTLGFLEGGEKLALESVGRSMWLTINGLRIAQRKLWRGIKTWIPVRQGWMVTDTNGPLAIQIRRKGKSLEWHPRKAGGGE